jgi:hypothetical protein
MPSTLSFINIKFRSLYSDVSVIISKFIGCAFFLTSLYYLKKALDHIDKTQNLDSFTISFLIAASVSLVNTLTYLITRKICHYLQKSNLIFRCSDCHFYKWNHFKNYREYVVDRPEYFVKPVTLKIECCSSCYIKKAGNSLKFILR